MGFEMITVWLAIEIKNRNTLNRKQGETQGKHGKYSKKLGKHEETFWEMEGSMLGIATKGISEPLSHQFPNSFIYGRNHPYISIEYANQYKTFHFSVLFSRTRYLMKNLS